MFIQSFRVKTVGFQDVADFSEGDEDLALIDIINDATKEVSENDFIQVELNKNLF